MSKLVSVEAKLPTGWNADEKKVVSEKTAIDVPQVESLEDAVNHFEGEAKFLEAVNSFLKTSAINSEYALRLARVKPSDLSIEQRIERAISAMVKTGFFTIDEARAQVAEKAKAGQI